MSHFQPKESMNDREHPNPIDLGKESTPEEIAQRRILNIKGPKSEKQITPPKAVLLPKLFEVEKKQEEAANPKQAETAPAAVVPQAPKQQQPVVVPATKAVEAVEKKPEVVAAVATPAVAAATTPAAPAVAKPVVAAPAASQSLFGNLAPKTGGPSGGLFGAPTSNLFTNTSAKSSAVGGGLFGSAAAGTSAGTGLFSTLAKDAKPQSSISNIFSSSATPAGSLFGGAASTTTPSTQSLFGNPKPAEGGLFGHLSKPAANSGLFSAIAPANNGNGGAGSDDEGEGDDDDVLEQSPEIDPSQVEMKVVYNNPYEKVVDKSFAKIRKGTNDVIEKGFVSLEKHKTDANAIHIMVVRNQIKTTIFSVGVQKNVTKVEKINNNSKNLKFTVYKKGEKGLEGEIIKVQFLEEKDGNEFLEKVKEVVS